MADFRTNLHRRFEDLLARFDDADGATASGRIVAGAEATSIKLSMSARGGEDGAQTSLSARLDAEMDGSTISATGDTATSGGAAPASVDLSAKLQEKLAVAEVIVKGDGAVTTAAVDSGFEIIDFQQVAVETPAGDPTMSRTYLEAVQKEPIAPEPPATSEESAPIEAGDADWLF